MSAGAKISCDGSGVVKGIDEIGRIGRQVLPGSTVDENAGIGEARDASRWDRQEDAVDLDQSAVVRFELTCRCRDVIKTTMMKIGIEPLNILRAGPNGDLTGDGCTDIRDVAAAR